VFERFTARARAVLVTAQSEALGLGHNFIGTEHFLVALVSVGDGVAFKVLSGMQISDDSIRAAIVRRVGRGPGTAGPVTLDAEALAAIGVDLDAVTAAVEDTFGKGALEGAMLRNLPKRKRRDGPHFTPRSKKLLELSLREALSIGHSYIGTEHLLLALTRMKEGVGYEILEELRPPGVAVREKVIEELKQYRPGA
jgi:ATP-dependent Clp protease ATP-binding subunit ClpA